MSLVIISPIKPNKKCWKIRDLEVKKATAVETILKVGKTLQK